jgi:hypothetical protein
MRKRLFGIILISALAVLAAAAAPSQARDRNHDRIPDKWEKRHHLTLRVNQARRDQDHDGLKNRAEFRAQDDPRDADSDNDGTDDGDEQAGTVTSFDGTTLTVNLFAEGSVTGKVTSATEIECDTAGDDDGHGGGDDDADESSLRHDDEGQQGDDHEGDNESCPAGALKAGAVVQEADIHLGKDGAVFEKIELVG